METYNLSATNKENEINTIKQTLYNNKYDTSIFNKSTTENKIKLNTPKTKWAKYTYVGKKNSVALVRERTIPTERPPLVGEVSANFCG